METKPKSKSVELSKGDSLRLSAKELQRLHNLAFSLDNNHPDNKFLLGALKFGHNSKIEIVEQNGSYCIQTDEQSIMLNHAENDGDNPTWLSFGRDPDSDIRLDGKDVKVSRRHGAIGFDGRSIFIKDDSMNGTSVDLGMNEAVNGGYNRGEINRLGVSYNFGQRPNKGEDTFAIVPEQGVFAVFDGVGGSVYGGALAAQKAAELTTRHEFGDNSDNANLELADFLNHASREIHRTCRDTSYATATMARIFDRDDKKYLAWASVGDSRLYVVDKEKHVTQVSRDEGKGNVIDNALGDGLGDKCKQSGIIELRSGDGLLLVTDGVTGDRGEQLLSKAELSTFIKYSQPGSEAENLTHLDDNGWRKVQKPDDRTAIYVSID